MYIGSPIGNQVILYNIGSPLGSPIGSPTGNPYIYIYIYIVCCDMLLYSIQLFVMIDVGKLLNT